MTTTNPTAETHYRFSGHETFPCRYTWLPKAVRKLSTRPDLFDFEDQAMVSLGVGKNMCNAARFFVEAEASRHPGGRVKYPGIDKGGFGTIIAENSTAIVIRWPGGKHWVGRGMPPGYHSPSTDVLRKDDDGRLTLLVSWDNKRKLASLEAQPE